VTVATGLSALAPVRLRPSSTGYGRGRICAVFVQKFRVKGGPRFPENRENNRNFLNLEAIWRFRPRPGVSFRCDSNALLTIPVLLRTGKSSAQNREKLSSETGNFSVGNGDYPFPDTLIGFSPSISPLDLSIKLHILICTTKLRIRRVQWVAFWRNTRAAEPLEKPFTLSLSIARRSRGGWGGWARRAGARLCPLCDTCYVIVNGATTMAGIGHGCWRGRASASFGQLITFPRMS